MDYEDDLPEPCPYCGGDLIPLGPLGKLLWCRCRHCGITVSSPNAEPEESHVDQVA